MTARGRLTILYTALVLAAGILLTGLTYLLMRRNAGHRISVIVLSPSSTPGELPPLPQDVKEVTLVDFVTQAAIALAVVTVLAAVLGWLVAGRVLRPIRTISATARRLSAENLSERMPVTGFPPTVGGDGMRSCRTVMAGFRHGETLGKLQEKVLAG